MGMSNNPANKKLFRVVDGPLRIREASSTGSPVLGQLENEALLEVDVASRCEDGGFVWWHHSQGWSAERTVDSRRIYMQETSLSGNESTSQVIESDEGEPITLPDGKTMTPRKLFKRLPVGVGDTAWIQYFGNTRFAQALAFDRKPERQRMYYYCQGLHGGIDFGNAAPRILVYAGLRATVQFVRLNSAAYAPNYVWAVAGNYTIIYGHVVNVRVAEGQTLNPDTIVAELDPLDQQHLHLEIRFRGQWVMNPLLFMPGEVRDPLLRKFNDPARNFYSDMLWNRWLTTFDQPVLKLSNPSEAEIIGPNARP